MSGPDDAFETLAFIVIAIVGFTAGFLVIAGWL